MFRLLREDVLDGLRRVRRSPRLAWLAVGTLALGIGAATAVCTMAHTVLFASPPFRDPDRLVYLRGRTPGWTMGVSRPDLADYRREAGLFDAAALANYAEFSWTGQSLPGFEGSDVLRGLVVTDEYFRVFDQPMALGRGFAADEGRPGREAAVISHALWVRRFGARPDVLGATLTLDGRQHTVVGVAGRRFLTYEQYEVSAWVAFPATSERRSHQYDCFARLGRGVTIDQAQRRLDALNAGLARAFPDSNKDYSVLIRPLLAELQEEARPAFLLLVGAVVCVLLISAANVTCLLLARAAADAREMAIRAALGAGRLRLFRIMVAQSLLLAGVASTGGAAIGAGLMAVARVLMPESLQFGWVFTIDGRVLVAALLVSMIAGFIAGLAPALETFRLATGGLRPSLHRHRLLRAVVTSEVTLAVLLSVAAGLLVRSFAGLLDRPLGYQTDELLGMRVRLQGERYATVDDKGHYWSQLVERVQSLPGVTNAASVSDLPMGWQYIGGEFDVDGRADKAGEPRPSAHRLAASPGYFATVGIPVLTGRGFTDTDTLQSEPVAIVNDLLAERFWAGQEPVGRLIRVGRGPWRRVVGVVRRIRHGGPQDEFRNEIYMPYRQFNQDTMFLVVRSGLSTDTLVPSIRRTLESIDPNVPAFEIRTLRQAFAREIAGPRLLMLLTALFAALATVLAGLGMFGVIAYWVSQRVKELGIRSALGAHPGELRALVLRQGGRLMTVGLTLGLALSLAAMRLLRSLLYGVSERDAAVYGAAVGVALLVTVLACWLPAARAARTDPAVALREQG